MLIDFFSGLNPIYQALIATLFTWFVTAAGAGLVFFFKTIERKALDAMLGFAAGVMIAASYWSLLAPAIEMSEGSSLPAWVPATSGFLLGGGFLWFVDKLLPHLHPGFPKEEAEEDQLAEKRPAGIGNHDSQYTGRTGSRCGIWRFSR